MELLIPDPYGNTSSAAYALAKERGLYPTWMGAAEIRELQQAVRDRAVFSARTTSAIYLDELKKRVERHIADGYDGDAGKLRLELKQILARLQYDPVTGFPGDEDLDIPPARAGSLQDLGSDRRINLILETQIKLLGGRAQEQQGMSAEALDLFPAYELVRIESRRVPREWLRDWETAADNVSWDGASRAALEAGRMIALKTSPIWAAIGSSHLFTDALDVSHPPFRFGSGMGWSVIERDEAEGFGLVLEDFSRDPDLKQGPSRIALAFADAAGRQTADPDLAAVMRQAARNIRLPLPPSVASVNGMSREFVAALRDKLDGIEARGGRLTLKGIIGTAPPPPRRERRNAAALCDGLDCLLLLNEHINAGTHHGALKGWETRRRKQQARLGSAGLRKAMGNERDRLAVMSVPGLGIIDMLWGARGAKAENEHGSTHAGGWGIHHIHSKRGMPAIKRLPVVLAHGKVGRHEESDKRYIRHAGWTAVVKRSRPGHWSVTTLIHDELRGRKSSRS